MLVFPKFREKSWKSWAESKGFGEGQKTLVGQLVKSGGALINDVWNTPTAIKDNVFTETFQTRGKQEEWNKGISRQSHKTVVDGNEWYGVNGRWCVLQWPSRPLPTWLQPATQLRELPQRCRHFPWSNQRPLPAQLTVRAVQAGRAQNVKSLVKCSHGLVFLISRVDSLMHRISSVEWLWNATPATRDHSLWTARSFN